MNDPKTKEQWQDAVDAAAACRMIAGCKMYGLVVGSPAIDVARCDELLARGAARGVYPSRPASELAIEMVQAVNGKI